MSGLVCGRKEKSCEGTGRIEEAVGVINNYFYVVFGYGELLKTSFKIIRSVIKAIRNFVDESPESIFCWKIWEGIKLCRMLVAREGFISCWDLNELRQ